MKKLYEKACKDNDEVIKAIIKFKESDDKHDLVPAWELCKVITLQEAYRILTKYSLPHHVLDDMTQDSWFKFVEAVTWNFNEKRCPVFRTFWRTSIRNHLISKYAGRWFTLEAPDTIPDKTINPEFPIKDILNLSDQFIKEYAIYGKKQNHINEMIKCIIKQRIFCFPEDRIPQFRLAKQFNKTQGYISTWEKELREKVKEKLTYLRED